MMQARRLGPPRRASRLILFNKPFGVISQFSGDTSPDGRKTLGGWINCPGVYPAGRLDKDSEGLLLLTDNGPLQAQIADPKFKLPKTYLVQVEGEPDAEDLEALRRGIALKDGLTLPAEVERICTPDLWPRDPPVRYRKSVPDCWLRLTLREGRNRQVRRMTAAIQHPTLRLVRCRIGPWTLDGIRPGTWHEIRLRDARAALARPTTIEFLSGKADKRASRETQQKGGRTVEGRQ